MTWWTGCKPSPTAPLCSSLRPEQKEQMCCLSDEVSWSKFDKACPPGFKADPSVDYCTSGISKYRAKCVRDYCK
jgi:hypothetical protein